MKKLSLFFTIFVLAMVMTSCYTTTFAVGSGGHSGATVSKKNHFLISGLAPIKTADPAQMAGGAANYTVTIKHSFVDGLIAAITGGIYTPTTTTVRK